jgi:hypothetical protein
MGQIKPWQKGRGKWNYYRQNAKRDHREFLLTTDQFRCITSRPCQYCGSTEQIGVDRVDNALGYVVENSVPCCWTCNKWKSNMSREQFLAHNKKIHSYSPTNPSTFCNNEQKINEK